MYPSSFLDVTVFVPHPFHPTSSIHPSVLDAWRSRLGAAKRTDRVHRFPARWCEVVTSLNPKIPRIAPPRFEAHELSPGPPKKEAPAHPLDSLERSANRKPSRKGLRPWVVDFKSSTDSSPPATEPFWPRTSATHL